MTAETDRKPLRIATAQFDATAGAIAANAAEHERLIDEAGAADADVLVFPELSLSGYASTLLDEDPERCVIDLCGPDLERLRVACVRNRLIAVVGGCRHGPGGLSLASMVVDRQGDVCATYRKQHLDGREKGWFVPGAAHCLIAVDDWTLGLGICYDASFPEHARSLALAGAEVYVVSGAFPCGDSDHRRSVYLPARGLENTIYVAFANFVGQHDGTRYCGCSSIHGPDGHALADAGPHEPGIAVAELQLGTLLQARSRTAMLDDQPPQDVPIERSVAQ